MRIIFGEKFNEMFKMPAFNILTMNHGTHLQKFIIIVLFVQKIFLWSQKGKNQTNSEMYLDHF